MTNTDPPTLRIKDVVELLSPQFPDVTPSSLRFLHREGLIHPGTTDGGQRRFSHEDVERIRRIKLWQAQHMPLSDIRDLLAATESLPPFDEIVARVKDDLYEGGVSDAIDRIERLWDAGISVTALADGVLRPVLTTLPDSWYHDPEFVDRQLELDERLIAFVSAAAADPAPISDEPVIVAACPSWERHDFGLRLVVWGLRDRGIPAHILGPMVTTEHLAHAVQRLQPDHVLLSCTLQARPDEISAYLDGIRKALPSQGRIWIGGQGVPALPHSVDITIIPEATSLHDTLKAVQG